VTHASWDQLHALNTDLGVITPQTPQDTQKHIYLQRKKQNRKQHVNCSGTKIKASKASLPQWCSHCTRYSCQRDTLEWVARASIAFSFAFTPLRKTKLKWVPQSQTHQSCKFIYGWPSPSQQMSA
jgi:hypothetical protein